MEHKLLSNLVQLNLDSGSFWGQSLRFFLSPKRALLSCLCDSLWKIRWPRLLLINRRHCFWEHVWLELYLFQITTVTLGRASELFTSGVPLTLGKLSEPQLWALGGGVASDFCFCFYFLACLSQNGISDLRTSWGEGPIGTSIFLICCTWGRPSILLLVTGWENEAPCP